MAALLVNCSACGDKTLSESIEDKKFSCECGHSVTYDQVQESYSKGEVTFTHKPEDQEISESLVSVLLKEGDEEMKDDEDADVDAGSDEDGKTKPKEKASKPPFDKEKQKKELKESISVLFEDDSLSEEFKAKTTTLFAGAVSEAVEKEHQKMQLAFDSQISEMEQEFEQKLILAKDEISENNEKYLDYVVEQYLEDNKVVIQESIRVDSAENVLLGLKTLFEENHLEVPESKDMVTEMENSMKEMRTELDKVLAESVEFKQAISEHEKQDVIAELSEGLADTQKDKLTRLSQSVSFSSKEQFGNEVKMLKEAFIPTETDNTKPEVKPDELITESEKQNKDSKTETDTKVTFQL